MDAIKFAVCNEIFEGWNLEKIFKYVSSLGYDGVEIAPFTISNDVRRISEYARRSIRGEAKKFGLEIVGIHWILKGVKDVHLTSPDFSIRMKTEEYVKNLVDFCSDIGGRVIVFGSPSQRSIPPNVALKDAWNWAVEILRKCSEYAGQHDVIICMEPLRKNLTNFINTVDEALKLINDVGRPEFKLILDVYAMTGVDESIEKQIEKAGSHLAHFHANDDNMGGPGFGAADYKSVVRGLRKIGFKGYVSVEILRKEENPAEAVKISIENLRRFFSEY